MKEVITLEHYILPVASMTMPDITHTMPKKALQVTGSCFMQYSAGREYKGPRELRVKHRPKLSLKSA